MEESPVSHKNNSKVIWNNNFGADESEPKISRKFCAVGNWRTPEQTWMCECKNFPGHQFALHFECEKIFVGDYFALQSLHILNFGHEFK